MTTLAAQAPAVAEDPVDALMRSIRIPPRPSLLVDLQLELARPSPSPQAIAYIITNDVGIAGALLKLANSPFYGRARKACSVEQGVNFLGINTSTALVTGLLARQVFGGDGASLATFWEVSAKRAQALVFLTRKLHVGAPDIAHTFGLFCDIGVPLLIERFPDYVQTFAIAGHQGETCFTEFEDARHATNHAAIGCLLARNWGLPEDISWAILLHHDYSIFDDATTGAAIRTLVALALLAEKAIQRYYGDSVVPEWDKGGAPACRHLGLSDDDCADLFDELHEMFETDH